MDYIYQEKYNSRIQRLVKAARLRFPQANAQDVHYKGRGINQELLASLFSCQYIAGHQSIILQGFTGSGKTYLACALGKQACLHQIRTRYIRLPDLLMEYSDAALVPGKQKQLLADGSQRRTVGSQKRFNGAEQSSAPDPLPRNNQVSVINAFSAPIA